MALAARDLKNDDTTDAGFDLILVGITSPVTGDIGITRIDVGTGTTIVQMDSSNPLFAQLTAGTAGIGKLTANAGVTIGAVEVAASQTIAVTNAGVFTVQEDGAALTALQLIDDIVHSGDAVVSKYAAIGAVFDDTTPGTVTENQAQSLRMSSERYLYTEIRDAAGNERGAVVDSSGFFTTNINGTVTVASHAVTNAGTFAIQISDTSFAVADGNALGEGVLVQGDDGTDRKNINVDATTGDVQVDVTNTVTVAAHAVTNAGVFVVQEDGAALTALQLIDDIVFTDDTSTHSTGITKGAGIMAAATPSDAEVGPNDIGMLAMSTDRRLHTEALIVGQALTALQLLDNVVFTHDAAGGTAVGNMMMAQRDDEVGSIATTTTDGDAQVLTTNKFGQLKTTGIADATSEVKRVIINAASGDNEIVATAGVGVKIRVLNVVCVAGGTTDCRFESSAGGTALTGIMKLVANSGFAPGYDPNGHFETADNAALSLECTGDIDGWLNYVEV